MTASHDSPSLSTETIELFFSKLASVISENDRRGKLSHKFLNLYLKYLNQVLAGNTLENTLKDSLNFLVTDFITNTYFGNEVNITLQSLLNDILNDGKDLLTLDVNEENPFFVSRLSNIVVMATTNPFEFKPIVMQTGLTMTEQKVIVDALDHNPQNAIPGFLDNASGTEELGRKSYLNAIDLFSKAVQAANNEEKTNIFLRLTYIFNLANAMFLYGIDLSTKRNYQESNEYLNQSLEKFDLLTSISQQDYIRKSKSYVHYYLATNHQLLGVDSYSKSELDSAINYLLQALIHIQKVDGVAINVDLKILQGNTEKHLATTYAMRANAYSLAQDTDKSIEFYLLSINAMHSSAKNFWQEHDEITLSLTYLQLALTLQKKSLKLYEENNINSAIENLQAALNAFKNITFPLIKEANSQNQKNAAITMINYLYPIALQAFADKQYSQAAKTLQQINESLQQIQPNLITTEDQIIFSKIYRLGLKISLFAGVEFFDKTEIEPAFNNYQLALKFYDKIPENDIQAFDNELLDYLHLKLGEYYYYAAYLFLQKNLLDKAINSYQSALYYYELPDPSSLTAENKELLHSWYLQGPSLYNRRAYSRIDANYIQGAIEDYLAAIACFQKIPLANLTEQQQQGLWTTRSDVAKVYAALAHAEMKKDNYPAAKDLYEAAIQQLKEIPENSLTSEDTQNRGAWTNNLGICSEKINPHPQDEKSTLDYQGAFFATTPKSSDNDDVKPESPRKKS